MQVHFGNQQKLLAIRSQWNLSLNIIFYEKMILDSGNEFFLAFSDLVYQVCFFEFLNI